MPASAVRPSSVGPTAPTGANATSASTAAASSESPTVSAARFPQASEARPQAGKATTAVPNSRASTTVWASPGSRRADSRKNGSIELRIIRPIVTTTKTPQIEANPGERKASIQRSVPRARLRRWPGMARRLGHAKRGRQVGR